MLDRSYDSGSTFSTIFKRSLVKVSNFCLGLQQLGSRVYTLKGGMIMRILRWIVRVVDLSSVMTYLF